MPFCGVIQLIQVVFVLDQAVDQRCDDFLDQVASFRRQVEPEQLEGGVLGVEALEVGRYEARFNLLTLIGSLQIKIND